MATMRFVQAAVLLLGAVVYVSPFFPVSAEFPDLLFWIIVGYNVLLVVVTLLAIVDSVVKVRAGRLSELAQGVFIVKLAAIPFFLINFAAMVLLTLGGTALVFVRGIGLAVLAAVAFATVLTYLTMISTSVYGWATVALLRRQRRIGTAFAVIYSILLCVFVADTVVGIVLFVLVRRGRVVEAPVGDVPLPSIEGSPT